MAAAVLKDNINDGDEKAPARPRTMSIYAYNNCNNNCKKKKTTGRHRRYIRVEIQEEEEIYGRNKRGDIFYIR